MLCRPILLSLGGIGRRHTDTARGASNALTGAAHQLLKLLKLSLNNNQPVAPELLQFSVPQRAAKKFAELVSRAVKGPVRWLVLVLV